MELRYWVCQTCKSGQTDYYEPKVCLGCGEVGGKWKSTDVSNMKDFRLYKCTKCDRVVEERRPPKYSCDICGNNGWKLFYGYDQ